MRQRFLSYFPYRHRTIFKNVGGSNWWTLNSRTPLSDELVVEAVSGQKECFRGMRWGDETRFAVLDIDGQSKYHDPQQLSVIKQTLTTIGITNTACYQSSISTGWHLYIPLTEWEESEEVTNLLKSFLRLKGFEVTSGTLEVFPSGAGLRLPLQFGFAWLDENGNVLLRREDLGADEAIRRFVHDIESGANDWTYTKSRISEELEKSERVRREKADAGEQSRLSQDGFDDLFQSKLIKENYELGKRFWRDGLTESGQRHDAVICVEHYLWHGDNEAMLPAYPGRANDEQRFQLISQWLRRKHNGFCKHISAGDWKTVDDQVSRACKWRAEVIPERIPYALMSDRAIDRITVLSRTTSRTWTPEDWRKGNDKRRINARQKIADTVEILKDQGRKVTGRLIAELTGCSRNTVRRHADLWLQCGSGDLEPGGSGDLVVFTWFKEDEIEESILSEANSNTSSSVVQLRLIEKASSSSGFVVQEKFFSPSDLSQEHSVDLSGPSLDDANCSTSEEGFNRPNGSQRSSFGRIDSVGSSLPVDEAESTGERQSLQGDNKLRSWGNLEGLSALDGRMIDSRIGYSGRWRSRSPP